MKVAQLAALLVSLTPAALADWPEAEGKTIRYTPVPGYFLQDKPDTEPNGFDYASVNFGLIERSYPTDKRFDPQGEKSQWERFGHWVQYLNGGCNRDGGVQYKMLFIGRHGQGWHNAAESFYGTPAWNCYWAEQQGNGTAVWADAHTTPVGDLESYKANAYFKERYDQDNMPRFSSYYSSPLTRCTITANLTFGDMEEAGYLPEEHPFVPIVKEGFREGMTVHTCNHRSSRSYIEAMFPWYRFEAGFTEEDELWRSYESETDEAHDARSKAVLDEVFRGADGDSGAWVSITTHSGAATRLLKALGHRPFRLSTGQIIPVLVKAEAVELQPEPTFVAHEPYSTCTSPPITSVPGEGCVCSSTAPSSLLPSATASGL